MLSNSDLKAVSTVTEVAKKLGLSRARFYQLQKTGVFPSPVYCIRTKRPFYPLELQQKCIEIRKMGIGFNGLPILFNASRKTQSDKSKNHSDDKCEELVNILRAMRLSVNRNKVRGAIKALYPNGLAKGPIERKIIRDVFRYFKQ
ncbi:MAG: helix-turn-helix transcriptional regulator [Planctomycetota bacterium]|jgi:hypothetical protein